MFFHVKCGTSLNAFINSSAVLDLVFHMTVLGLYCIQRPVTLVFAQFSLYVLCKGFTLHTFTKVVSAI